MSTLNIIKILATILCVAVIIWFLFSPQKEKLSIFAQIKISFIGLIANFFDTLGIGSFALIIAMRGMLKVMPDDIRLIGTMNIHAVFIAVVQTLIFLNVFQVDTTNLIISIVMISLGSILSGIIAIRIKHTLVHKIMLAAFIVTGILLLFSQLNILPISSNSTVITGYMLIPFAIFMFIAGMLPGFGIGYYSLIKSSIFLFGVSPIVAFPLMAAASAFQQPITSAIFISNKKFYFKSALLLGISGSVGVLLAAPLISKIDPRTLKWWLLFVVVYNIITFARSSKK